MSMNIEFVGRNYQLDDKIRRHTEDKLAKMTRFLEEPVDVRVTLEVHKHRQVADVHVNHKLGVVQAREEAADMYDAINAVVDTASKQARRNHKKVTGRKRRAGNGPQPWALETVEAEEGESGEPRIIRQRISSVKPMSVEEAALQLDESNNEFIVFRDAASEKVSVLYRRRDNNYGLIAPEL